MTANVRAALLPFCAEKPPKAVVFEHADRPGEPMCGISFHRRFISTCRKAGLPRIRLHDLRHTFGTQAARELKIHEVQALMGHGSTKTTERYLHYVPDPQTSARLTPPVDPARSGSRHQRRGRLLAVSLGGLSARKLYPPPPTAGRGARKRRSWGEFGESCG